MTVQRHVPTSFWTEGTDPADANKNGSVYFDSQDQVVKVKTGSSTWTTVGDVSGGGGVDTSGTPGDNQLAVFVDSDTIEGDSSLTWDGSELAVEGFISGSSTNLELRPGGDNIDFEDNAGNNLWFINGSNGNLVATGTGSNLNMSGNEINNVPRISSDNINVVFEDAITWTDGSDSGGLRHNASQVNVESVSSGTVLTFGSDDSPDDLFINNSDDILVYNSNQTGFSGRDIPDTDYVDNTSDERLKTNIEPLDDGLERINQLNPVTFEYVDGARWDNVPVGEREMGLVGQQAMESCPEVVYTDEVGACCCLDAGLDECQGKDCAAHGYQHLEDAHKIKYGQLVAALVGAVQELSDRLDELEGSQ